MHSAIMPAVSAAGVHTQRCSTTTLDALLASDVSRQHRSAPFRRQQRCRRQRALVPVNAAAPSDAPAVSGGSANAADALSLAEDAAHSGGGGGDWHPPEGITWFVWVCHVSEDLQGVRQRRATWLEILHGLTSGHESACSARTTASGGAVLTSTGNWHPFSASLDSVTDSSATHLTQGARSGC